LPKIKGKTSNKSLGKTSGRKTKKEPSHKIVRGKFIGNEIGFGFVVPDPPQGEDIFIPPNFTWGALHGDEVLCRLMEDKGPKTEARDKNVHVSHKSKKGRRTPKALVQQVQSPSDKPHRQSGEIIEITHRKPLLGTYFTIGQEGYIRPMEKKIPHAFSVSPKSRNRFGLVEGHRVIFVAPKPKMAVDKRGNSKAKGEHRSGHYTLSCQVTEVLGHVHDPGVDVLTLVRQYNIPYEFPEDVISQTSDIPEEITQSDLEGRLDLRHHNIITIDGEDTKDIDDAISFSKTSDGHWHLGVHIADVSRYVQAGTPIDLEALNRGTSVYLADRVIPMLPHKLSSGICSLFPGVDRLTVSCIMNVDTQGDVISYDITTSVINSKRRWTYDDVQEILDNSNDGSDFAEMDKLREILYQKRRAKGALDFDLPEAKIRVDEEGRPISIEPYPRTKATGIIEEFMILCNETIAAHALRHDTSLIFRAHDAPTADKLARLKGTAEAFGLNLPYAPGPLAIQRLLEAAENTPAYQAVAMAALTSLPQAIYTPDSPKHYGLASEAYCHFTSPIRRYADLQVHRIIKSMMESKKEDTAEICIASGTCTEGALEKVRQKRQPKLAQTHDTIGDESLNHISAQCSRTEREAEALEREVTQLKKVQFMKRQEGAMFEGVISGITPWGVYVMLENTVEGLLPSQYLKKMGYSHNKDTNRYADKRTRTSLAMGAPQMVRLVNADEDERRIVFALQ